VLLFSIATSIELFQAKLPKESIGRLAGAEFGLKHIDFDETFQAIHYDDSAVYFGPAISSRILQQQRDFIQSPAAFAQTLKVFRLSISLEHLPTP